MPSAAQRLATRRSELGLPETIYTPSGSLRVSNEVCDWVEFTYEASLAYTLPPTLNVDPPRISFVIHVPWQTPATLSGGIIGIQFTQTGRWTTIWDVHGEHRRGRHAFAHDDALAEFHRLVRQRCYEDMLSQPNPPSWAHVYARQSATERNTRERQAIDAQRAKQRKRAEAMATESIIAAHKAEYDDLVEAFAVEIALSEG